MRLIVFLFQREFKKFFKTDNKYKVITWILLIFPVSVIIGLTFAQLYDWNYRENFVSELVLLLFTNSTIAIGYLLLDIYPFYKKMPLLFPNYYPLNKFRKTFISLLIYSLRIYTLFVIILYLAFYYFSNHINSYYILYSLLFVFTAYIVNRSVKNIFEFNISFSRLLLFLLLLVLVGFCWVVYHYGNYIMLIGILFTFYFLIVTSIFIYTELNRKDVKTSKTVLSSFKSIYAQLLSNPNISKSYPYAFLFKAFYLGVTLLFIQTGDEPPMGEGTMWMFASPIIIIIFAAVNFFGHNRNLLLTHIFRLWNIRHLVKTYFYSMGILILIDSFIFWIFLTLSGLVYWENVIFYYSVALILSILGFWFALNKPVLSDSALIIDLSFLKNQESRFNFIGIVTLILLYFILDFIKITDFQLMYSLLLFVTITAFVRFYPYNFKSISHNVFSQL